MDTELSGNHVEKTGAGRETIQECDNGSKDGNSNEVISREDCVAFKSQPGVQDIEAVTITWSKRALIGAYLVIWLVYFVQSLVGGINSALLPYITSAFAEHSLTPTTGVVSSVIGGVTNLSIGKALDIFGRPQGFLFCTVLAIIGLVISAACTNVESYAASQVFYTIGINGMGFTLNVFLADITSLRNRGLVISLCSTAYIVTPWLGGPISSAFLAGPGWRWAFGMESILIPAIALIPFSLIMVHFFRANKLGIVSERSNDRTLWESLVYYIREFDTVGLLLLSAGVAFILLPFNLYTVMAEGWGSALIICFLVVGVALLIAFAVWEKSFAPISFIPWTILRDRQGLGACGLSLTLFLSNGCWAAYFSSILQVVNGLDVTYASYIVQSYSAAGFFFTLLAGLTISYTGRYKPFTLYLSVPFSVLGSGLMIYFRESSTNVGYIVMCQIFMAFGSGTIIITAEIAMLAVCEKQQYFAVGLALLSMFSNIGNAIGFTISSAIWQRILPSKLAIYLPAQNLPDLATIYGDIVQQLSYPVNTPTRQAINRAYGDTQMYVFTASTVVWTLGLVSVLMWRNIDVTSIRQTKGRVF
ncbi:MFS transporter-like protein 69 [Elsinoe australis]|uniref:MFS transporter-like protein 69 n=1 Tax=Elsinoe australis TaxID=40998 RepID=A0A4V6DVG3_9PEZI|nr:MFS transporter-like protein 69 [Elsinoe australis]